MIDKCCAVPLREQLANVPTDARLMIFEGEFDCRYIPVGRMCHEAAARIEQLERELAAAQERYRWLADKTIIPNFDGTFTIRAHKGPDLISGESIDAAIDAAMKEARK